MAQKKDPVHEADQLLIKAQAEYKAAFYAVFPAGAATSPALHYPVATPKVKAQKKDLGLEAENCMRDALIAGEKASDAVEKILKDSYFSQDFKITGGVMMAMLSPLHAIERAGLLESTIANCGIAGDDGEENQSSRFLMSGYSNWLDVIARIQSDERVYEVGTKIAAMAAAVDAFRGKFTFDGALATLNP